MVYELEKLANTDVINFSTVNNNSFDEICEIMNKITEVLWNKKFSNNK